MDLITVREAAQILGLSAGRVYVFLREGRLKYAERGRLRRADVEAFAAIPRPIQGPDAWRNVHRPYPKRRLVSYLEVCANLYGRH